MTTRREDARQRPPWWPENEPWPPVSGPPFAQRLLRRVGLALFVLFAIGVTLSILSSFLWSGGRAEGPPPFVPFFVVFWVGLLLYVASRVTRRFAQPLGDVMDAVHRLAGGDYSARVEVDGPAEIRALGSAVNTMAARLESGEEQRRNLVADIAHEVRTPLAIIRGNIEGVLDGVYPADEAHLGPVLEEVDVIARLIDDLHTLSSAEAGVLRLHREPVDLAELIQDVTTSFAAQSEARGVELAAHASVDPIVSVDPARIRQVLENLLTNALRHTEPGGSIEVRLDSAGAGYEVSVRDTGTGIPPDVLPHIFERYRKAPDSTGSGLGLAIARRLVEAHGGTIAAESTLGEGTTIRFTLPGD